MYFHSIQGNSLTKHLLSALPYSLYSLKPSQSESNLYPLEYLFAGGTDPESSGKLQSKLASITDSNKFMLYLWKQHNAVTATTYYNWQCKNIERFDEIDLFRCFQDNCTIANAPNGTKQVCPTTDKCHGGADTMTMGRSWPTANRYEFWLNDNQLWNRIRSSSDIQEAYQKLKDLNDEHGWNLRQKYVSLISSHSMQCIQQIQNLHCFF